MPSNPGSREAQEAMAKVKAQWPRAWVRQWSTWRDGETGLVLEGVTRVGEQALAWGDDESALWISAANHPTVQNEEKP